MPIDLSLFTKAELIALIERMDRHAPVADKTCNKPGIPLSEACRRMLIDEQHSLFATHTYSKD